VSYDLVFFRSRAKGPVTREHADEAFARRPCFDRQREGKGRFVYTYENPDTDVTFSFELDEQAAGGPGTADAEDIAAGLTFSMSFCRPSFFAAEAMPIVAEVAWALDVKILDPQDKEHTEPRVRNAQALERAWLAGNAWACSTSEKGTRFAPKSLLDEWWRTMRARRAVQRRLGDGDYAPRLLLLARKGGASPVQRAVVWAAPGPLVLPEAADLVHLCEPGPARVVPAAAVRELLREHLVPLERAEAPASRWNGIEGKDAVLSRVTTVAGDPPSSFEALDAHHLHDVPAPAR
jgi:hypothetical protein